MWNQARPRGQCSIDNARFNCETGNFCGYKSFLVSSLGPSTCPSAEATVDDDRGVVKDLAKQTKKTKKTKPAKESKTSADGQVDGPKEETKKDL